MKTDRPNKTSKIKAIFCWMGWSGFILCFSLLCVIGCSQNTMMNEQEITYKKAKAAALPDASDLSEADAQIALERITQFLQNIGSQEYIEQEISNVYAENAYLNDTLKTLINREEIKDHFVKTSKTMTTYSLVVDDTAKTDKGYYLRWTMKFAAPKLASGEEIVSVGMSHIIFDSQGKVLLHQDFWDSSTGLFEHVPFVGGGIRMVKKRL
jgi:hypothetical protein